MKLIITATAAMENTIALEGSDIGKAETDSKYGNKENCSLNWKRVVGGLKVVWDARRRGVQRKLTVSHCSHAQAI